MDEARYGTEVMRIIEERDRLLLQVDQMRDVVEAACAYESIMGFDDLNSAYRNRREVTDAFVKAVGAYKTRLPEKRVVPMQIVAHCDGTACCYLTMRTCICLCAKCEDAKARDH